MNLMEFSYSKFIQYNFVTNLRTFSLSCCFMKKSNHYHVLGVTPKATQNDIKSAYYKLSMIHHPDKNKGSTEAMSKFRDISEAYEVLGNYKLRKLYDKGIIHVAGPQYSRKEHVEDDADTKFYKSRQFRSRAPHASGSTPIYDFDEWTKAHYGDVFKRRKISKDKFEQKTTRNVLFKLDRQKDYITVIVLFLSVLAILLSTRRNLDVSEIDEFKKK